MAPARAARGVALTLGLALCLASAACTKDDTGTAPTQGTSTQAIATGGKPATSPEPTAGMNPATAKPKPTSNTPPIPSVRPKQSDPALSRVYRQRPTWTGCGRGFECTRVGVPLDYAKPGGSQIGIAVIRQRATDLAHRIGSLVINPGGPGGSGVEYARNARALLPARVRARFDIVGFDPRGVGGSAPVRCLTGPRLDRWLAVDPSPDDAAEISEMVVANKEFARGCKRRTGELLAHVGTRDAVRDLDVLRAVLGDKALTYLGKSYGTLLGALYAELFPGNVRALLLDGAVDPSIDAVEQARDQAVGFERALDAFFARCAKDRTCDFGKNGRVGARFDALMARIDRTPLSTADGGRLVGPAEALIGVAAALYDRKHGWPALAVALERAERSDGSELLQLFDAFVDRDPGGDFSNKLEAYSAVNCLDRPVPRRLADFAADARRSAVQAPRFGAALAYSAITCAYWPVPSVDGPAPITAPGAPPILVVGTTRDPATPVRWSEALAGQLESGVLLVYDGDGHTVYGDGVACVDDAGNAYLIDLLPPKDGARCG